MIEHFPKKDNSPNEYSDGQTKQCPNCGSLLGRYNTKFGSKALMVNIKGFHCPDCDFIGFNRKELNLAIESILYNNITK